MSSQTPHIQRLLIDGLRDWASPSTRSAASPRRRRRLRVEDLLLRRHGAASCSPARQLGGRPVKWVESRRENYQSTIHGRDHITYLEIAGKRDGEVTGLRVKTYRQPRRPPLDDRPGHPDDPLRPGPVGLLQDPQRLCRGHRRLHQHRVRRRLPRRRPARGDLRDRAGDGPVRRRDRDGPRRGPPQELHPARASSRTTTPRASGPRQRRARSTSTRATTSRRSTRR